MNRSIAAALLLMTAGLAAAQTTPTPVETVGLGDGVYVLYGNGGNIGVSSAATD